MEDAIRVEQATTAEFCVAFPLLERFFREEGFATPTGQIHEELQAMLGDDECAVFLAWLRQAAIGVATVTTNHGIELGLSAELEDLYVLPDERGRGAGRALIEAVKVWCQARGCRSVSVVVTPEGQAAYDLIGYYSTLGFEASGRTILFTYLHPRRSGT